MVGEEPGKGGERCGHGEEERGETGRYCLKRRRKRETRVEDIIRRLLKSRDVSSIRPWMSKRHESNRNGAYPWELIEIFE